MIQYGGGGTLGEEGDQGGNQEGSKGYKRGGWEWEWGLVKEANSDRRIRC